MVKSWLTGEEVMRDYGLAAAELGRLCHESMLTAFLPEVLKPIYDPSVLPRVPQYPPIWVPANMHIQRGETIRWDWESILGVDKLRKDLRDVENELNLVAMALIENGSSVFFKETTSEYPFYKYKTHDPVFKDLDFNVHYRHDLPFEMNERIPAKIEELNGEKKLLAARRAELRDDIRQLTLMPSRARNELGSDLTDEKIWLDVMTTAFNFLVEGRETREEELQGRLFLFDFDMFQRHEKALDPQKNIQEIIAAYKERLAALWFDRLKTEVALGNSARLQPSAPDSKLTPSGQESGAQIGGGGVKNQAPPKKRPRKPLTVEERRNLLARAGINKSAKTIERWDKGQGAPKDYNAHADALAFSEWAMEYAREKSMKRAIRGAKNPIPLGSMDDFAAEENEDPYN